MMKLNKLIASLLCATAIVAHGGRDWYVDANKGNDLWDGTTAAIPTQEQIDAGGTVPGPRKTLSSAMAIEGLTAGDIVHAAAGLYNEGGVPLSDTATTNRVLIKEGVGLVADAGPELTIIEGYVPTPEETGYISTNGGNMSVRCVYMKTDAWIKDFTIRNGSTKIAPPNKNSNKSYGDYGGGVYGGTAIGCVITNCYAVRGGGASYSTLVRCRVVRCGSVTGKSPEEGKAQSISCSAFRSNGYGSYFSALVTSQDGAAKNILVNCTCGYRVSKSLVYNSYCNEDEGNNVFTNSIVGTAMKKDSISDGITVFSKELTFDDNMRALNSTGKTVDSGDIKYLDLYPEVFSVEASYDLSGGRRINGKSVDIGCGEYISDYYVDAEHGNDSWDGTESYANRNEAKKIGPKKTLAASMLIPDLHASNIVHAAAGVYDTFPEDFSSNSRVIVKEGVGLVADEWPLKETIIVGAASASENADSNGNGPGAVRCVNVRSGAYVKGFKLTGGRTSAGDESSNAAKAGGGAYLNGGALIACEVTGNSCAYRGSGVYTENSSWIIGCNVHGNSGGSFQIINGGVANSRVTGIYYGGGIVLNSRIGTVRSSGGARVFNSYLDSTSTSSISITGPFCTNCVFTSGVAASITDNSTYDPSTCVFSVSDADNLDDNFRPKNNVFPLVDAGSRELYDRYFPAKWGQFKDIDLRGGQRIYNAKIDVGCGEYDWRGDFASMLGTKAAISEMGENVTVDSMSNIVVPEGDTIALSMPPRSPGRTTKYELTYTPEGGERAVLTEVSTEAFSYVLAGPCTVQSLTRSGNFTVTIR